MTTATIPQAKPAPRRQVQLMLVLDGYEGPIDLLLDMANSQKIDLREIAILPLAEQYLAFIADAKGAAIDLAADYLVMAAWLTYLKSRLLLPDPDPEEEMEAQDMAEALRARLLHLEAMRKLGKKLMALPRLGQVRFATGKQEKFAPDQHVWQDIALYDLLTAYGNIATRQQPHGLRIDASQFYSVDEAVIRLRHLIKSRRGWVNLLMLLPPGLKKGFDIRTAVASHFAAALEIARHGEVALRQDKPFAPLYLSQPKKKQARPA